jgi:hypothetical protein
MLEEGAMKVIRFSGEGRVAARHVASGDALGLCVRRAHGEDGPRFRVTALDPLGAFLVPGDGVGDGEPRLAGREWLTILHRASGQAFRLAAQSLGSSRDFKVALDDAPRHFHFLFD